MTYRFASPELLRLGPPPPLAASDFETLNAQSLGDLLARFNGAGIAYNVANLETDPAVILTQSATYRDMMRRQQIDDAVAQTYLGSATGAHLDQRAADYGVVRRVVQFADPSRGLPEVLEDDDSLRMRAHLAWEATSVAGPAGAYVFHTLNAHAGVFDALAIGPETGIVQPGEVLVVLQSRSDGGIPAAAMLDVVAEHLDAFEVIYADGSSRLRTVRNLQSGRPLGDRVTVAGARPRAYTTTATLYIGPYADAEALRIQALANLQAHQDKGRRIWRRVSKEGRQAALSLVGTDGLPVIDEVEVAEDDVIPTHMEIPTPGQITLNMVVR